MPPVNSIANYENEINSQPIAFTTNDRFPVNSIANYENEINSQRNVDNTSDVNTCEFHSKL